MRLITSSSVTTVLWAIFFLVLGAKPTTAQPMATTGKPTTAKPTTAKPKTTKPTTAKPTTAKPTTAKPTTPKPTTDKPTTAKPTTAKPTTAKPTTAKPTTAKPITNVPTTAKPTIAKPTTAKPTTSTPRYVQRGVTIYGEDAGDYSGDAISLSSDGNFLAIGARNNGAGNNGPPNTGHVRVFAWNATVSRYVQRGVDIDGEAPFDNSGCSISLSSDGSILAIGAYGADNDSNGARESGHVRVYAWNASTTKYDQRGVDIDGEETGDFSGSSVSLSSDGSILAVGAIYNGGNGADSGHVRVYAWTSILGNFKYIQRGVDIDGEAPFDQSGSSISLSSDGRILAIGARGNDGNGAKSGHVRVYEWTTSSSLAGRYIQRGDDIDGEAPYDYSGSSVAYSGSSVALSNDGSILAIGAEMNDGNGDDSGHVRVYIWNNSTSKYDRRGVDIDGEAAGDYSGGSVSLSSDGSILAIGAPGNDGNGPSFGHVRVYAWNDTTFRYIQRGDDINGEQYWGGSGASVFLSSNGSILAVGAPGDDGDEAAMGSVRVFVWS